MTHTQLNRKACSPASIITNIHICKEINNSLNLCWFCSSQWLEYQIMNSIIFKHQQVLVKSKLKCWDETRDIFNEKKLLFPRLYLLAGAIYSCRFGSLQRSWINKTLTSNKTIKTLQQPKFTYAMNWLNF